jgi:uncharacterized protein YbjT (DUF2867 family)
MKIVVIGGRGLIGSRLVEQLDAVAACPSTGVDAVTGEGLAEALAGADVVVDASNAPSFEDAAVMEFFTTATRNLLAAEQDAGVGHHVLVSVVGCDRLTGSGYMRAKVAQERLVADGQVPYTIARVTQFLEFVPAIADAATAGDTVRMPQARCQPIAVADAARAVAAVALGAPAGGIVEIGGPEAFPFAALVRQVLGADPRHVVTDPDARYFGAELDDSSLLPGSAAATHS